MTPVDLLAESSDSLLHAFKSCSFYVLYMCLKDVLSGFYWKLQNGFVSLSQESILFWEKSAKNADPDAMH
jgi:hypothetical protein